MSEAVKVVVKCRPMNRREHELNCKQVLDVDPSTGQCSLVNAKDRSAPAKTFTFDGAYGSDATNEQVYLDIAFPLVEGVTEGYNGTVFAYGQTGCGKTFTMQGVEDPESQRGLIPRAFDHIFDTVAVAEHTRYLIHASFLEIYNEEVRDLLGEDTKARLELRERPEGTVFVQDLSMHAVSRVRDCEVVMKRGWKNRATGSTLMNAVSSRSHSIFTIHLERCDDPDPSSSTSGSSKKCKIRASKLNLVDLAGSERQSKSGATGDRLKEATKINLSLSALGNVISALVDGRSVHVPYRDSKLTRLLQDSLGGNTKTLMIACVSPADNNYEESLSTLRYANRAKNIKNKPRINEDPKDALIRQYLDEISRLKEMLSKASSSSPAAEVLVQPPTPEPQIIEKIVQVRVPDEEEIRIKTRQIAAEYEKKIQKMAAEVAEARADSDRTAAEMDRLRAESEAKQRALHAEYRAQAETERVRVKQEYEAEMERVQRELNATRHSRESVQTEMETLRRQYEVAMFAVEKSVPPEQLHAERERLRLEYETNMRTMRDELEAVKASRTDVETEMEKLRVDYEARISAARSTAAVASTSTSSVPLSTVDDPQLRRQNLTDEMKMVSDGLSRVQTGEVADQQNTNRKVVELVPGGPTVSVVSGGHRRGGSTSDVISSVQSKLITDSLSRYSTESSSKDRLDETAVNSSVRGPSPVDVEKLLEELASGHKAVVDKLNSELDELKSTKENIATVIHWIKTEYHRDLNHAQDTVPGHELPVEKMRIREKYERQMDRVKDDLGVLKSRRNIVSQHVADETSVWNAFQSERQKIDDDAEAGRIVRASLPGLVKAASTRYLEESRRLAEYAAAVRESEQTAIINDAFQRDERRVLDDVESGRLSQSEADAVLAKLLREKADNLSAARQNTQRYISLVNTDNDDAAAANSNTKLTSSDTGNVSDFDAVQSGGDAVAMRLKTLEDALVGGGIGSGSPGSQHRRRAIREKLRREKQNAEDKARRLHEAIEAAAAAGETVDIASALCDVFSSTTDELAAKTRALRQLQGTNENLHREIVDLQAEFEFDRIDYLDTIRKQDQALRWYQGVVETVLPAIRRDSNYADLERVRAQSDWDDLNQRWNLPKLSFDRKRFCLPPASLGGQATSVRYGMSSSASGSSIDYELRCEDRLIEKLQESELRDPAAVYFRSTHRAGTSVDVAGSEGLSRDLNSPVPVSPLLRRPRQM